MSLDYGSYNPDPLPLNSGSPVLLGQENLDHYVDTFIKSCFGATAQPQTLPERLGCRVHLRILETPTKP